MQTIAKIVFFISIIFILYTYFGYAVIVSLIAMFKKERQIGRDQEAYITVVISMLDEKQYIERKLRNLLGQQYAKDKIEIIVVSDGSTDGSDEIVRSFSENTNIKLYRLPERKGKAVALNLGISHASGEIVILTDARQLFETDALKQLSSMFCDPGIGAVSGALSGQ